LSEQPGSDEQLVDLRYAGEGGEGYAELLEESQREGKCLFCPENLPEKNSILYRSNSWTLILNISPYENAAVHLLLVPDQHITDISQITPLDWAEMHTLIAWAKEKFPVFKTGGALAIRYGTNSGVTVKHLHAHYIAPVTNPDTGKCILGEHVNFPIG